MNPAIEQLRRLRRFGSRGERLFNEHTALAYRAREHLDPDRPWQLTGNALEWRQHGDVVTMVHALLSLPAPGSPAVPAEHVAAVTEALAHGAPAPGPCDRHRSV